MCNRAYLLVLASLVVTPTLAWGADAPATRTAPAGSDLASSPAEWTFEAAGKCWNAMTKPIQHVGVPGCQWQVGVYYNGALLFGDLLHWKPP
jgi:hypothetical protein